MTFLLAKEKTMHVCIGEGRWLAVSLKDRDGSVAVFETAEQIPVGAQVTMESDQGPMLGLVLDCHDAPATASAPARVELSVEFSPKSS